VTFRVDKNPLLAANPALAQRRVDHPGLLSLRPRGDEGEVGLAGFPVGKGLGQGGGGLAPTPGHQHARGIAVEAVHQPGDLARFTGEGRECTVHVAGGLAAALHGKPGGLVKGQHRPLIEQDCGPEALNQPWIRPRSAGAAISGRTAF